MSVETLGDAWTHGVRMYFRCAAPERDGLKSVRACGWKYELEVMTLMCTRGRDFPVSMLSSRMRCPMCGSRSVYVALSFPGQPNAEAARRIGR